MQHHPSSTETLRGKVISIGMADADLIRQVQLLGHREVAQIITEAGATFMNRTWFDARIRRGLAEMARYEDGPPAR